MWKNTKVEGIIFIALFSSASIAFVKFRLFYIDLDMIHSIPCISIHINFHSLSCCAHAGTVFGESLVDDKSKYTN